jgi:hypothetical protein
MPKKATGGCKFSPNIRNWSGVLDRLSRLLTGPKNPQSKTEEDVEVRYVLPYRLP